MNIKDSMSDSFLRVVFNEALNQGYSLQDITRICEEVEREKNLVCFGRHGSCKWSLDNKGTLVIEPQNGERGILSSQDVINYLSPWDEMVNDVKKVVVKEGVSTGKDASFLFAELHNCVEMDLSGLNTSKTEDMESILSNCFSLEKLNLGNWDVSNVRNMDYMFSGCQSLKTLDISSFNTKFVESATRMFKDCKSLEELKVSEKGFNFNNAVKPFMFEDCHKLKIDSRALEQLLIKPEKTVKVWTPPKSKDQEHKKEYSEPNR